MIQDTCIGEKCKLYKKLKCKDLEECPDFCLNTFTNNETGQNTTVKDCYRKRSLLIQQDILNGFIGIQQSIEQLRNQANGVNCLTKNILTQAQKQLKYNDWVEGEAA